MGVEHGKFLLIGKEKSHYATISPLGYNLSLTLTLISILQKQIMKKNLDRLLDDIVANERVLSKQDR